MGACRARAQRLLVGALDDGDVSLTAMARRMVVSQRTLQRHLAEQGTTWRAELDAARRWRAGQVEAGDPVSLARELGYSHPRSARRAVQRWAN